MMQTNRQKKIEPQKPVHQILLERVKICFATLCFDRLEFYRAGSFAKAVESVATFDLAQKHPAYCGSLTQLFVFRCPPHLRADMFQDSRWQNTPLLDKIIELRGNRLSDPVTRNRLAPDFDFHGHRREMNPGPRRILI